MNPLIKYTNKKIVLILFVIFVISTFAILYAFNLKEKNILTEQNSNPRVALLVISVIINFLAFLTLLGSLLTNLFLLKNLDFTVKKSKATYLYQFLYFLLFVPYFISIIYFIESKHEKIEESALEKYGIVKPFIIDSVYYSPGKGRNYEYYFKNSNDDIHAYRKNDILNIGDTVYMKHIPNNISVYREVELK